MTADLSRGCLSLAAIARRWGVHPNTAREQLADCPRLKVGTAVRYPLANVEQFEPSRSRDSTPGIIYVLQSGLGGHVKIGFVGSYNMLEPRILSLQTGNPEILRCLYVLNGRQRDERALHRKFRHFRIRGEWFRLDDRVRRFFESGGFDEVQSA